MFEVAEKRAKEILEGNARVAVFMMGGSGSGKTFVREHILEGVTVLDSDTIKEGHPDYDPKNPKALHEWSREVLARAFFSTLGTGESFVYDGTGTNAERMAHWMKAATSAGYHVVLCFVKCSLATAIARNRMRPRRVPLDVIKEKHSMVATAFEIASGYADEVLVVTNN